MATTDQSDRQSRQAGMAPQPRRTCSSSSRNAASPHSWSGHAARRSSASSSPSAARLATAVAVKRCGEAPLLGGSCIDRIKTGRRTRRVSAAGGSPSRGGECDVWAGTVGQHRRPACPPTSSRSPSAASSRGRGGGAPSSRRSTASSSMLYPTVSLQRSGVGGGSQGRGHLRTEEHKTAEAEAASQRQQGGHLGGCTPRHVLAGQNEVAC